MREVTAKSVKLGRDLDGMLSEALERDLLVRIGSVSYTHLTLPTIYSV